MTSTQDKNEEPSGKKSTAKNSLSRASSTGATAYDVLLRLGHGTLYFAIALVLGSSALVYYLAEPGSKISFLGGSYSITKPSIDVDELVGRRVDTELAELNSEASEYRQRVQELEALNETANLEIEKLKSQFSEASERAEEANAHYPV